VENAIKHGDLGQQPQAFVQITLHTDEKRLFFEVKNSFNPENRQKDTVGGVGLENVRQRLALHPKQRGALRTTATGHLFTANLELIRHHDAQH
jgi:two-component system, LytTR family, sensor kinase